MLESAQVAVVVPAYNEERWIGQTVASIPAYVDHVIVVDDASRDRTAKIAAQSETRGRVRPVVIRHAKNLGVGAALVTGYRKALELGAFATAVMAGDGQMHPDDLSAVLLPVVRGEADYSKGDRLKHPDARRVMPVVRRAGTAALAWLTRHAAGLPELSDSQCGFTAISARALAAIDLGSLWQRYGYPNDLLGALARAGLRVRDVPVRPVYRGEASGLRPWHALTIGYVVARVAYRRLAALAISVAVAAVVAVMIGCAASPAPPPPPQLTAIPPGPPNEVGQGGAHNQGGGPREGGAHKEGATHNNERGRPAAPGPATAASSPTPTPTPAPAGREAPRRTEAPQTSITVELPYKLGQRPAMSNENAADERRWNQGDRGAQAGQLPPSTGHPLPRVIIEVTNVKGPRSADAVQRKARQSLWGVVIACYRLGAYKDQTLRGKTTVRFQVSRAGAVTSPKVMASTLPDAEVVGCLRREVGKLNLGAAKAGATVTATLEVYPGDDPMPPPDSAIKPGSGVIAPEEARRVAQGALPRFEACYRAALGALPMLWGRLAIRLHITAAGKVDEAFEVESRFPEPGVAGCVLREARALMFPAPSGGDVRIVVPLRLSPASSGDRITQ